jgi:formylglycine-generating enzyme required for sulfatase activity
MGANGEKAAEHHLEISKFQMSKTPITNWQFKLFVDDTGYKTEAETNPTPYEIEHGHINWRTFANNRENYPVVWITWNDAIAYGEWLTKVMVMLDPKSVDPLLEEQPDGSLAVKVENPYRLPSEAEWEFAARGGQAHPIYPWGDKPDPAVLNCKWDDRSESIESARKYIQPVANHSSNPYGLFDMAGNIDQWCYDWYSADYYTNSPEADPFGPAEGNERITRGGNWLSAPEACHVTSRHHLAPIDRNDYTGFRLARTVGDD